MQACKGNANIGDGSVSPTLCKPSGNDVHAVAFAQNQLGEVRVGEVTNTLNTNSNASGRNTPMVAIGTGERDTHAVAYPIDTQNMTEGHSSGGLGFGQDGDPSFTVTKGHSHAVAIGISNQPTPKFGDQVCPSLDAKACGGGRMEAVAIGTDMYNHAITGDVAATMGTPGSSVNASGPTVMQAHGFYSTGGTHGVNQHPEVSPAVKVGSGLGIPSPPAVAHAIGFISKAPPNSRSMGEEVENGPTVTTHMLGQGVALSLPMTVAPSLTASNDPSRSPQSAEVTQQVAAVHAATMTVRRLTPRECERLQAFPDDYTLIPWRKKSADQCPDGPRYKALGNSMAVNCMEWIGERIAAYEARSERHERH
jgi:hypothetical protein